MIGTKIYFYRKEKQMSLSELAERANISKSYLSTIERNMNPNPSIYVIDKIAKVLDVDIRLFLEDEAEHIVDLEWRELIKEFKKSGIKKEHIDEYKDTLIDFIKWKKNIDSGND